MSVTFSLVGGPTIKTKESCFRCEQLEGENCNFPLCKNGEIEYGEDEHQFNLGNANAKALIDYLGLDWNDGCGEIHLEQIPKLRRKIVSGLNVEKLLHPYLRDFRETETRERFFSQGLDVGGFRYRLEKLDEIFVAAQKLQLPISFW